MVRSVGLSPSCTILLVHHDQDNPNDSSNHTEHDSEYCPSLFSSRKQPRKASFNLSLSVLSRSLSSSISTIAVQSVQTELGTRNATRRRRRVTVPVDGARSTRSRNKDCGQINHQLQPRSHHAPRKVTVRGDSSVREAKTPICSRTLKVSQLEAQLDTALKAERALAVKLDQHTFSCAQLTLKHLEEYFTCPLCFEILACPYTMTPRNCGHTFCATCILKWFFSRLHKGCGGWHEAVDCPLCRSTLPHTPERTPRSSSSFPFTPNRTADTAIRGLINTISHELDSASAVAPTSLSDWNEEGHSKQEWSKREKAGRTEITSITAQWNTLKPNDFVNIKMRLEV